MRSGRDRALSAALEYQRVSTSGRWGVRDQFLGPNKNARKSLSDCHVCVDYIIFKS